MIIPMGLQGSRFGRIQSKMLPDPSHWNSNPQWSQHVLDLIHCILRFALRLGSGWWVLRLCSEPWACRKACRTIWNLSFVIWDLNDFILEKILLNQSEFCKLHTDSTLRTITHHTIRIYPVGIIQHQQLLYFAFKSVDHLGGRMSRITHAVSNRTQNEVL